MRDGVPTRLPRRERDWDLVSLVDRQNRGLQPRCRGGDPNWFPNRGNFPERRASYINYLVITDYPCPCASTRPARKRRKATLAIVIDRSELSESWKELNRVTEAPICIHLSVYTISDTNCNCEYVSKALRKQSSGRTNFTFAIAFCVFIFSSLSLLISIASNEFLLSNRTRFSSFFFLLRAGVFSRPRSPSFGDLTIIAPNVAALTREDDLSPRTVQPLR